MMNCFMSCSPLKWLELRCNLAKCPPGLTHSLSSWNLPAAVPTYHKINFTIIKMLKGRKLRAPQRCVVNVDFFNMSLFYFIKMGHSILRFVFEPEDGAKVHICLCKYTNVENKCCQKMEQGCILMKVHVTIFLLRPNTKLLDSLKRKIMSL